MSAFRDMVDRWAQPGELVGIYVRSARLETPLEVETVRVSDAGLDGDHARPGKRAVTLIQAEHLPVIGAMLGRDAINAVDLRRNLVVSGLNLIALKGRDVRLGSVVLHITGICAPCSRMETCLGPGGYSAMRGHGGWCARVVESGRLSIGDRVSPISGTENSPNMH